MSGNLNNVFINADNRCIIFASQAEDGNVPQYRDAQGTTPVQENDLWFDIDGECIRKYMNTGTGLRWQSPGVLSNSKYNGVQDSLRATLNITDLYNSKADVIPQVVFSYGPNRTKMYSIISQNDNLYFAKADGSVVLTLKADGDALFANNVTVVGDLFADDVSYDVNQCNILKVADAIQHVGNETNQIVFATDKMTLDASGTSIVLDDTAMTNSVVVTGQTQFVNAIGDVPDIYLQNHIHHVGDVNTRIGFPANDQISLRTGGTDRILVADAQSTISNSLLLNATEPRIIANMNGGTWNSRLIMQTSNANASSKLYVLPSTTVGLTQAGSAVFSNIGDLNAASYNLYEVGQYPTECRNWSTAASGDPLPFSWRFGGSTSESMRLVRTGTASYPSDYDVLMVGDGVTADGGANIAQQGIIIKQRGQIQWNAAPADGGPAITMFRATNSADLVISKGWRNSNTSGTAWESSATTSTARTALQLSSGSINFFINPTQAGTAGSASGVTPQQIMSLSQASTITSQNSATTVVYQQSLGGLTPFFGITFDVDIGRSNSNYTATIDSATYIANQSWWNNSVARGYNLNGTLYAASITNLSQNGLVCTITGVSASVLRFAFTDTSGNNSTKVGTCRITVTSSN